MFRRISTLLTVLVAATVVAAQVPDSPVASKDDQPDNGVERRIEGFFAALNSGTGRESG